MEHCASTVEELDMLDATICRSVRSRRSQQGAEQLQQEQEHGRPQQWRLGQHQLLQRCQWRLEVPQDEQLR